ncbi:MAG TPA: AmmeMemoRadiSam system radical SAM enzyme [bacterium]|nr:AmmeMemoRadiSam system radical SAM enzyme [bacterium]
MTTLFCDFCEHRCALPPEGRGRCGIRENRDGTIVTVNYGELVSLAVDPVEKKPLYHFLPGTGTLSLALHGCNLSCSFCQNSTISQKEFFDRRKTEAVSPADIVAAARKHKCESVSFTYSEPTVWQDYMIDTARLVKAAGLRTVMVTNGWFTNEALDRILPLIDAFNIDLKGDNEFYRTQCGGTYAPVLRNIGRIAADPDTVLEVTTLIIEGIHSAADIVALGKELAERGVQVWHLSRYYPNYRMKRPPTAESFLFGIYERVRAETILPYVYLGNSNSTEGNDTRCAACGLLLISRKRFSILDEVIDAGHCPSCRRPVYGLFSGSGHVNLG